MHAARGGQNALMLMGASNDDTEGVACLRISQISRDPRRAHARLVTP